MCHREAPRFPKNYCAFHHVSPFQPKLSLYLLSHHLNLNHHDNAPRPLDPAILAFVEETSDEDRTTHAATCHCGAVRYTATLKYPFPRYPVNKCYDNLSSYKCSTKTKSHKFCKTCGSSILIDFQRSAQGEPDPAKDILAVNVRHFIDIDLDSLEYTFFDGRKRL